MVESDNRPCARERDGDFDDDYKFNDSVSAVLVELDATFLAEAELIVAVLLTRKVPGGQEGASAVGSSSGRIEV